MKDIVKLSLSLLGNQFLASVGGFMCVIFVWMLAGDSIAAQLIFLAFTIPFFIYIEYRSAFKSGFHNPERRKSPNCKAKWLYGAIAGAISAIPLCSLILVYVLNINRNVYWSQIGKLYARIISMYYNWPMCNIFPNHTFTVFITSIIPLIIVPMLGYAAGYNNFMVFDVVIRLLKKSRILIDK